MTPTTQTAVNRDGRQVLPAMARQLLATPPDQAYDRLAHLVSRILRVPMALVAVLDGDREFCSGQFGLPDAFLPSREIPLRYSFCKHVLASGQPLIINDTRLNRLVADNPAIAEFQTIAYAGVPLVTSGGDILGTFCVLDARPRAWRQDEIDILTELAVSVVTEIELQNELAERKRAEASLRASEQTLRTLVEHAGDYIFLKDLEGRYLLVNPAVERLFNRPQADILGRTDEDLFLEADADEIRAMDRAIVARRQTDIHERVRIIDGEQRVLLTTKSPYLSPDGEVVGLIGISRDITDRKRMEEELRRTLEKERELNELKASFISMVAHEFRNPLAVIQSSSDLIKRYGDRMAREQHIDHLDRIQDEVKHLIDLLNETLTLTKSQTVEVEFQPTRIDFRALVTRQVAEARITAPHHEIRLNAVGQVRPATGDERLLSRAVGNLLSNAIKYSPHSGIIEVEIRYEEAAVSLSVRDNGIGIFDEDQKHLYELFHRGANVGTIWGTGLGLAIVKQAVDAHGGTITCASRVGAGTTFTMQLPLP